MPRTKRKAFRSPPLSEGHIGSIEFPASLAWAHASSSDDDADADDDTEFQETPAPPAENKRPQRRTRQHALSMTDEDEGEPAPDASSEPHPSVAAETSSGAPASLHTMDLSGDESTVSSPASPEDKEPDRERHREPRERHRDRDRERERERERRYRRPHSSGNDRLEAARFFVELCCQINGGASREIPTQKQIQKAGMDTKWQQLGRNLLKELRVVVIDTKTRLGESFETLSQLLQFLRSGDTEAELFAQVYDSPPRRHHRSSF